MTSLDGVRTMSLFEGLEEAQLSRLFAVAKRSRAAPGTDILREGENSFSLFILASGSVQVSKRLGFGIGEGPLRKTIVRLTAPQFFGEMALLGDTERTATISASEECELLEISKDDFDRLVGDDLPMGYRLVYNLATVLCDRLRRTDRDVLKLTAALSLALGNR
jgi:CRP/FNR family transcriptional regulator, cyclic AMP receptor protein